MLVSRWCCGCQSEKAATASKSSRALSRYSVRPVSRYAIASVIISFWKFDEVFSKVLISLFRLYTGAAQFKRTFALSMSNAYHSFFAGFVPPSYSAFNTSKSAFVAISRGCVPPSRKSPAIFSASGLCDNAGSLSGSVSKTLGLP